MFLYQEAKFPELEGEVKEKAKPAATAPKEEKPAEEKPKTTGRVRPKRD